MGKQKSENSFKELNNVGKVFDKEARKKRESRTENCKHYLKLLTGSLFSFAIVRLSGGFFEALALFLLFLAYILLSC